MFYVTLAFIGWYLYLVLIPLEERPYMIAVKDFFYSSPTKTLYDLDGNFVRTELDYDSINFDEKQDFELVIKAFKLVGWTILEFLISITEFIYIFKVYKFNKYLTVAYLIFWISVFLYNGLKKRKQIDDCLAENEFPRVGLDKYFSQFGENRRLLKFFNVVDLIFYIAMGVVLF